METETVKTEHTPGPWFYDNGYIAHKDVDGDYAICEMHTAWDFKERDANAEFIVRACNSHYELLESCKKLMAYIDNGTLVRNTANDAEDGWAIKMLPFVQDLKAAQEAIKNATL